MLHIFVFKNFLRKSCHYSLERFDYQLQSREFALVCRTRSVWPPKIYSCQSFRDVFVCIASKKRVRFK